MIKRMTNALQRSSPQGCRCRWVDETERVRSSECWEAEGWQLWTVHSASKNGFIMCTSEACFCGVQRDREQHMLIPHTKSSLDPQESEDITLNPAPPKKKLIIEAKKLKFSPRGGGAAVSMSNQRGCGSPAFQGSCCTEGPHVWVPAGPPEQQGPPSSIQAPA